MFKYETHLHTSACSACAVSSAFEMVDAAVAQNYSGIVLTNHFYHGNSAVNRDLPWKQFVEAYADEYYAAEKYGEKRGVSVFFGIEEVYYAGKEMLIYGLKPEILQKHPEFNDYELSEQSDFVHKNGAIAICAHPYRDREWIPHPNRDPDISYFDGIESFNYCNRPEENEKAFKLVEKYNLIGFSGGDIHNANDFGHSGVAFEKPVNTIEEFIENIKSNNFKLIINDEII